MSDEIEIYRDMAIKGPVDQRLALRDALIEAAVAPWCCDLKRSAEVMRNAVTKDDVLLFRREAAADCPAVGLTLWGNEDGYFVPNVVPIEFGELTFGQYNAALADFIECVAKPVAPRFGYTIETTEPSQRLEDWVGDEVARLLRVFSDCANKATGASHPMDERRWFAFLVAAHRAGGQLGADRLVRWLHEVAQWDEEIAHRLAGNYENGLALLNYYDHH